MLWVSEFLLAVMDHQQTDAEPQQQQSARGQQPRPLQLVAECRRQRLSFGLPWTQRHAAAHDHQRHGGGQKGRDPFARVGDAHGFRNEAEILGDFFKKREASPRPRRPPAPLRFSPRNAPHASAPSFLNVTRLLHAPMAIGALEALCSGVITEAEIDWLLSCQSHGSRTELATLERLGRLLDRGVIHLGCRI